MGAELLADPEIGRLADACSDAAGIDLRYLLAEADDDELRLTTNAQPALLFMGVALARLLGAAACGPRRQPATPSASTRRCASAARSRLRTPCGWWSRAGARWPRR